MGNKILVVDDTDHILKNLTEFLEMEGYSVSTATNGEDGLRILESKKPDLLITDLVMPKVDGFSLIRELRKQERLKLMPILIFSAKPMEANKIEDLGVRFVLKPCSLEILLGHIKELLHDES
jgi:DNA-binding response OmpR family regulator